MAEPTTSAAVATLAVGATATTALTAFGVPLGLRADLLIAGFSGSLVAIVLLNSVPSTGDTWQQLLRTALRRVMVAFASSLTAGYITPMSLALATVPEAPLLGGAFIVGAGAQHALVAAIRRISGPAGDAP